VHFDRGIAAAQCGKCEMHFDCAARSFSWSHLTYSGASQLAAAARGGGGVVGVA
jgi:hypothetical protein